MIKPPKGIEFHREFASDMKRMVHALEVLFKSKPAEPKEATETDQSVKGNSLKEYWTTLTQLHRAPKSGRERS
ncbi:hypothetical protein [Brevibacillus porteri]|uniref:Uncharacterized protein n=1 Tax=Brevibacillus porteri TaxID=2126350 RepID=A0ABX5FNH6_9BACL|nr:hypothetical protein [Brevibacillus porteri]MED1798284.1 hypothetical protein [Brevibacillus porteri]MED2134222.1 hypothetical protein [Brevibacillus porteri]MED2744524.1 hypothetical protein [Brevibacillus porteri]MED2815207.1 hypothetical protein [Brevibacillus porteri]MED2897433.1 hypothetical protein [Brevibacillus porteri]